MPTAGRHSCLPINPRRHLLQPTRHDFRLANIATQMQQVMIGKPTGESDDFVGIPGLCQTQRRVLVTEVRKDWKLKFWSRHRLYPVGPP